MVTKRSLNPEPYAKKLLLLAILVVQNSLATLVGRLNRKAAPEDLYNINNFVLVAEVGKLLLSFLFEAWTEKNLSSFQMYLWNRPKESLKMAVPAALYWGSNTLLFVALSKLTVPIFQVAYQGKLVITALVSVCVLGRSYTARQWFCLVIISLSIALIASEGINRIVNPSNVSSETVTVTSAKGSVSADISGDVLLGMCAIAMASLLSAFAGVYFELIVKTDRTQIRTPSLWMRNIHLSFFSIVVSLLQLMLNSGSGNGSSDFFHGFTCFAWLQVILFAAGGLLVASVIQDADNVLKGLATGISVLASTAVSAVLYKTQLTPTFLICAVTTVVAVYLFFSEYHASLSHQRHRTKYTVVLTFSFLFSQSIVPLQEVFRLRDSKALDPTDLLTKEVFRLRDNEVLVPTDLVTNVFPVNFNSTTEALHALRSIQDQVVERHIHEGTHILYDLRTAIGNRPVKYLEIGSSTGISALLMLRHPYPTFATLVDPCILSTSHFRGTMSQEETIRKNMGELTNMRNPCRVLPWELRVGFSPRALPKGETFDIIFIDDHSRQGVFANYNATIGLLRPGGFMVFDNYLDSKSSPEVRPAVDDIARSTDLIAIGTPPNIHGIHPEANQSYINEYIFQKRGKFQYLPQLETDLTNFQPMLGITVATYRRSGLSTPSMLENLWLMLVSQSYSNWKLYLTGDFYENETEWRSFSFCNHSKASLYNLPEPGERGNLQGIDIWKHGGTAAVNNAIDRVVADGIQWVVHLDDDDYWDADHLQNVVAGIRTGATFVMVECQYHNRWWLPTNPGLTNISHTVFPQPCGVIHSSIAFNAVKLTSRYKITPGIAADADLWSRIVFDDNFFPAFVPIKSCHHLKENGSRSSEINLRRWDLLDHAPPPGWYNNASRYTSLASTTFPANLSTECVYIIGPQMNPPEGYSPHFKELPLDMIPYHIRTVEALAGLPVWKKQ